MKAIEKTETTETTKTPNGLPGACHVLVAPDHQDTDHPVRLFLFRGALASGSRAVVRLRWGRAVVEVAPEGDHGEARLYDSRGVAVQTVTMEAQGKYAFGFRHDKQARKDVPFSEFTPLGVIRERKDWGYKCDRGDTSLWKSLQVVEVKAETVKAILAVELMDGSFIGSDARPIERGTIVTGPRAGEVFRSGPGALNRRWDGRGLFGVWSLADHNPECLQAVLQALDVTHKGSTEFPFMGTVDVGTVYRLSTIDFEVVG